MLYADDPYKDINLVKYHKCTIDTKQMTVARYSLDFDSESSVKLILLCFLDFTPRGGRGGGGRGGFRGGRGGGMSSGGRPEFGSGGFRGRGAPRGGRGFGGGRGGRGGGEYCLHCLLV